MALLSIKVTGTVLTTVTSTQPGIPVAKSIAANTQPTIRLSV